MTAARIHKELEEMARNPPPMCSAGPLKGSRNEWMAQIQGPQGSPYEGGTFKIKILFHSDFPREPPRVQMLTKIFHPNIIHGNICLDILSPKWKPNINVCQMLLAICALLGKPNPDDPLDRAKAAMYLRNRPEYNRIARKWTSVHAN